MALRPKTARRMTLVVAALLIAGLGGAAALIVPKWQRARQIDRFHREGLTASEEGNHYEALASLGRYVKAVGEPSTSPEVFLALARSRKQVEAPRLGHLDASATHYRSYLRQVPDDDQAAAELASVLTKLARWGDAIKVAADARDPDIAAVPDDQFPLLRDELQARSRLRPTDPLIETIERRLLDADPAAFVDAWRACLRRIEAGDVDGARAIASRFAEQSPGTLRADVLRAIINNPARDPNDPTAASGIPVVVERLANLLREQASADADARSPDLSDPDLVTTMRGLFDAYGQLPLSIELLETAPATAASGELSADLARRYYFEDRAGSLLDMNPVAGGRPTPDVMGYQMLAAAGRADTERVNELKRELKAIDYDYRAKSWGDVIEAIELRDAGNLPDARASVVKAVDRHEFDPAIRVVQGDIFYQLGQYNEALSAWEMASRVSEPVVWFAPLLRRSDLLLRLSRGSEATEMWHAIIRGEAREALKYQLHSDFPRLVLRATAGRGIRLEASLPDLEAAAKAGELLVNQGVIKPGDRAALDLVRCQVLVGGDVRARAIPILASFIRAATDPMLVAEARALDWEFGLGAAQAAGLPPGLPESCDPRSAWTLALGFARSPGSAGDRVATTTRWLEQGVAAASPQARPDWLLARAKFASEHDRPKAVQAWRDLVASASERADLLAEAVQSDALGFDRAFVEQTISKIRDLTQTQGRELPGHLRLARAKSIFGLSPQAQADGTIPGSPVTKQSRDEAISVVRAVITAEPRNLLARKLLAGMLATEPATAEAFVPDFPAAIEQLQAATSLVSGPVLIDLLFDLQQMALVSGDRALARRALEQIAEQASEDYPVALDKFASRLLETGSFASAAAVLDELMAEMDGPGRVDVGLLLVRTYASLGQSGAANRVLEELAASETLTAQQLIDIASGIAAGGAVDRARSLLSSVGRFGYTGTEARYIRAVFEMRFGSPEAAEQELRSIVQSDPDPVYVWSALAEFYIRQNRGEEAAALLGDALSHHPDDQHLIYLAAIARGDIPPTLAGSQNEAFARVQQYEREQGSMPPAAKIEALRKLGADYPGLPAVQGFTLQTRLDLGDDPAALSRDARQAAVRFPNNAAIAGVAARSTILVGPASEGIPLALAWRGLVSGSRQEPDVYLAAAYLDNRDAPAAARTIEPYVDAAFAEPAPQLNAQTILVWARAQVRLGNQRAMLERLEPLVRSDEQFRGTVWLDLVVSEAPDPSAARSWLEIAQRDGGLDEHLGRVANVWLRLATRFEREQSDMLHTALEVSEKAISRTPDDLLAVATQAEALSRLASIEPKPDATWRRRAAQAFARADELDPTDLNFLFRAARMATEADDHQTAIVHYRTLLSRPACTGFFQAVVRNNLAMVLARSTKDPAALAEAIQLADQAIAFRNLGGFVGTRGWARLAKGEAQAAVQDFTTATGLDPGSTESWAGLAVALAASGADPAQARTALARSESLRAGSPREPWLSDVLRAHDLIPTETPSTP